jgi:hypothetical protein
MDGEIEQYVCIKFCVKLSKSVIKTLVVVHDAFGEHSLSWTMVFEWHSRFKAGQASVADDKHSGRPSNRKTTENVETVREHFLLFSFTSEIQRFKSLSV